MKKKITWLMAVVLSMVFPVTLCSLFMGANAYDDMNLNNYSGSNYSNTDSDRSSDSYRSSDKDWSTDWSTDRSSYSYRDSDKSVSTDSFKSIDTDSIKQYGDFSYKKVLSGYKYTYHYYDDGYDMAKSPVYEISITSYSGYDVDITVPDTIDDLIVTAIDYGVFRGITDLKTIKLPDTLKTIGKNAFSRCSGLTSINIPSSLTSIEESAFSDCSSLTSIVIPDGVTKLNSGCFAGCTSLAELKIPASVTVIDRNLFADYDGKEVINENLIIYCESGSQAEKFAKYKGIKTSVLEPAPAQTDGALGDMDGDGKTTSADSLSILRMSVGLEPTKDGADVDNDGKVTSADSLIVLRYSVGLKS